MYHSHLLINVGDNPDRPDWRICRQWLRNLYRVHQRLCMAFPSAPLTDLSSPEREALYCRAFNGGELPHLRELPAGSNGGDVHHARSERDGFLFRVDYPVDTEQGGRRPVILVQSANKPDWDYAFGLTKDATDHCGRPVGNAGFLLAAEPQVKEVSIESEGEALVLQSPKQNVCLYLRAGDLVRFRLRANPTRKVQDGSPNGKRKRVKPELKDHDDWLSGKLAEAADSPIHIETFVPGWAHGWRTRYEPQPSQRMQWWSVLFEGSFRMKDAKALKNLLNAGIGPGKAFGFGLLSVARA